MNERILIFEDDEDIAELEKMILTAAGFQVHTYPDTRDHIAKLLLHAPSLVLMDYMLPVEGGLKATRQIKEDKRVANTPVLIVSAAQKLDEISHEAGADGFIKKPFGIQELVSTVRSHLGFSA